MMQHKCIMISVFIALTQQCISAREFQTIPIPIHQNISNNETEKPSGFYATAFVRQRCHRISHNVQPDLRRYSAEQLKEYFAYYGYTPKQILEQYELFTSDEFIIFAKTLPIYENEITSLQRKFRKRSGIVKWLFSVWGARIKQLYQEMQEQKQKEIEKLRYQIQINNNAYKQKLAVVAQQSPIKQSLIHNARAQALESVSGNHTNRMMRTFSADKAVIVCANQYGITQQDLTTGYMNAYEYQIHTEFVEQLAQLTDLCATYLLSRTENLFFDAIGEGVALGIAANKKNEPVVATCWADFGWEILE
jgi:hypothetical protein